MAVGTSVESGPTSPSDGTRAAVARRWTSDRAALLVFIACLGISAVVLLTKLGSYRWFLADEWEFLADREVGDLRDWFRPHGGHWVTAPVLMYRGMFTVFGFDYVGYQAVLVAFHLSAVALVRVVMRRAGVGGWVATIASIGLLLFGSGEDDIVWAFQIAFVGALVLGFVQVILLDHDGPLDRRDWIGLGCGLVAIMFSGVGIALVLAAGVAALLRRGWRIALFHTVPPAVAYAIWWWIVRPAPIFEDPNDTLLTRVRDIVEWVLRGVAGAFGDYGYLPGVGLALGVLLVAGLVLAWYPLAPDQRRARAAAPLALLIGGLSFLTMTGVTRATLGTGQAASSRYVYVVMACALPAMGIAADSIIRRWRWSAVPIAVLLVVGIPGNIGRFGDHVPWVEAYFDRSELVIRSLPRSPEAGLVDQDLEPATYATGLSIGWLRAQVEAGRLDEPDQPVGPLLMNELRARLAVAQTPGEVEGECVDLEDPIDITVDAGDVVSIREQPVRVEILANGAPLPGAATTFNPDDGARLTAQLDGLALRFTGLEPNAALRFVVPSDEPAQLCR